LVGKVRGAGERTKDVRRGVEGKEKLGYKTLRPKGTARGDTCAKGESGAEELGKGGAPAPTIVPLTGGVGDGGKNLSGSPVPTGEVCPGNRDNPKVEGDRAPNDRREAVPELTKGERTTKAREVV
jgi:hypothetical protein